MLPALPLTMNSDRKRTWDESFEELILFKTMNGNCLVPTTYKEDPKLGRWVDFQRTLYQSGQLLEERRLRLESVGFVWNVPEMRWNQCLERMKKFREKTGHCKFSQSSKEDPELGRWVEDQRRRYNEGTLPKERLAKLQAIDFIWKVRRAPMDQRPKKEDLWKENYEKLVEFHREHLHCNVRKKDNQFLGSWISRQRLFRAQGLLPKNRERQLDKLGIDWDSILVQESKQNWKQAFVEFKAFVSENGLESVKAGKHKRWLDRQFLAHKKGKLFSEHKILLAGLGVEFAEEDPQEKESETEGESEKPAASQGDSVTTDDKESTSKPPPAPASKEIPDDWDAYDRLLPLMVELTNELKLCSTAKCSHIMQNCQFHLERMVARERKTPKARLMGPRTGHPRTLDAFGKLMALAAELADLLDDSSRGKKIMENCEIFFKYMTVQAKDDRVKFQENPASAARTTETTLQFDATEAPFVAPPTMRFATAPAASSLQLPLDLTAPAATGLSFPRREPATARLPLALPPKRRSSTSGRTLAHTLPYTALPYTGLPYTASPYAGAIQEMYERRVSERAGASTGATPPTVARKRGRPRKSPPPVAAAQRPQDSSSPGSKRQKPI